MSSEFITKEKIFKKNAILLENSIKYASISIIILFVKINFTLEIEKKKIIFFF